MGTSTLEAALASALLDRSICSTAEEARIVAGDVLEEAEAAAALPGAVDVDVASNITRGTRIDRAAIAAREDHETVLLLASRCAAALEGYVDASPPDLDDRRDVDVASACEGITRSALESCGMLLPPARPRNGEAQALDEETSSESDGDDGGGAGAAVDEDDSETEEYIGEGECELCERSMPLTRHHLIPKSTHPRMKTRIHSAIACRDPEKTKRILDGLPDVPDDLARSSVRAYLASRTCQICRPCHSMVHRLHDEMDLAENYNTVEKLWADENVVKFCNWARKQRTGRRVHAGKLNFSR